MNKMDIVVLFGHRRENYEGQYAPEVLAAIDEFGQEENPDYMKQEMEKFKTDNSISALALVTISVNMDEVKARLYPEVKPIDGEVK